jgi:hypothetical protein
VSKNDFRERGFLLEDGKLDDSFIGTESDIDFPADRLRRADLAGHTHPRGAEGISGRDRLGPLTDLKPGGQELIRTPSGAILSTKKPAGGGPLTRETLRGPASLGFPRRE